MTIAAYSDQQKPRDARSKARLPIVAHNSAPMSVTQLWHIAEVAEQIRAEDLRLCRPPQLAENLTSGLIHAPALVIEDHSAIQLAHERGADTNLSYRAIFLAGEGDVLAVYGERYPAFEAYCREQLGLGEVEVIAPSLSRSDQSLTEACLKDAHFLDRVVGRAKDSGGLNVIPYMATGSVWHLAGEIAKRADVPVRLAGPSPSLMGAANNKLWFARWAAKLLGRDAVPQSRSVYGMAALVGQLRRFMRQHGSVAIKLSHSAASLGNLVFDSADFAEMSATNMAHMLKNRMREKGWRNPFPVQVTAWEGPLLATPSAQLWIPDLEDGPPIVEGIFDQIVTDTIARFSGAVPSDLPQPQQQRIADDAMQLGLLLQRIGYFGRCSFDAVLVDQGPKPPALHWVECNGRWGGVSIPMTLANRLLGDWQRRDMLIIEQELARTEGLSASEFLDNAGPEMFIISDGSVHDRSAPSGAVLLSPGRLASGAYDLLVLGNSEHDVLRRERALAALLAR